MWKNEEMQELQSYARQLCSYPVLRDRKKVTELIKRWRKYNDKQAYNQLIYGNTRLIISIACKYRNRGAPLLDIVQEGFIGLARALESYDPKKGALSTYATLWIRATIQRLIRNTNEKLPYRLADRTCQMIGLVTSISNVFFNKNGRWPNDAEIYSVIHAADVATEKSKSIRNMTMKEVRFCLGIIFERYISLNAPTAANGANNTNPLGDVVADPMMRTDEIVEKRILQNKLAAKMRNLKPRIREILYLRFWEEMTLSEIGKRFGLSRERVRQIEENGLECLRRGLEDKKLNKLH
jgi:RNA polymerase primary sigma factor